MYHKGKIVTIKTTNGKYIDGVILDLVDFDTEEMWWVQVKEDGRVDVNVYSATKLDEWNKAPSDLKCTCGSTIAGQSNRHSYFCDIK